MKGARVGLVPSRRGSSVHPRPDPAAMTLRPPTWLTLTALAASAPLGSAQRTAVRDLTPGGSTEIRAGRHESYSWRYYRPGNTGIQGDYCEAVWVGPDGDPWIGGYDPSFEEGGVAKLVQAENRWLNVSNVDHPLIGHPNDTGTSRVSDILADASGRLWMATGRGALSLDPAVGASSLVKYDATNSTLPGGWTEDVELAPDGTLWFAARSTVWGGGGIARYAPASGTWSAWPALGEHLSAQPKPGGGYYVWNGAPANGPAQRFDSATQSWTLLPATGAAGEVAGLMGKDCTDAAGNFWALRTGAPGDFHSLDYRRPDGLWVSPPQPYPSVTFEPWVFHAFGDRQALLVDGNSTTWRFNGAGWQDLGVWRPGAFTYAADIDAAGNVWVCGVGGAARRDATSGQWQRYRITNTGQYDAFNEDLTLTPGGGLYACASAGGIGGMVRFDGTRWTGFNNGHYGLGEDWPFPTDNSQAVYRRPSSGRIAVNPTFHGVHEWDGAQFTTLQSGTTVKDFVEDSLGRLWFVGEYYSLEVRNGTRWTQVGIEGWGAKIRRDPELAGTVWATTGSEIKRTDGATHFSRLVSDFPELDPQSDNFTGLAVDTGGIAWVGAWTQFTSTGSALLRLDANTGAYQIFQHDLGWPFPGEHVRPLALTPDGRLWMQYDSEYPSNDSGLCWYDGTNVRRFPAPPGGQPQWGGLPNSSLDDLEVRVIPGGYELWMTCLSRGIAVLTVESPKLKQR